MGWSGFSTIRREKLDEFEQKVTKITKVVFDSSRITAGRTRRIRPVDSIPFFVALVTFCSKKLSLDEIINPHSRSSECR